MLNSIIIKLLQNFSIKYINNVIKNKLNLHLFIFLLNFIDLKNKTLRNKISFALDGLIFSVYNDTKNLNFWFFLILGYCTNMYLSYISFVLLYFSYLCFGIAVFIKLIEITKLLIENSKFKFNNPKLYLIIKFILFVLLIFNIICIIMFSVNLVNHFFILISKFLDKLIIKTKTKFNNYKTSLKKQPKEPKDPKPELLFAHKSEKNYKEELYKHHKGLFEEQKKKGIKYPELKEQEIELSKDSSSTKEPLRERIKWTENINIETREELSLAKKIEMLKQTYDKFENLAEKFEGIINNINENKEEFFPEESKSLFKEYVEGTVPLKDNLQSMITNLEKSKKKIK
jgi:hypothetical protein